MTVWGRLLALTWAAAVTGCVMGLYAVQRGEVRPGYEEWAPLWCAAIPAVALWVAIGLAALLTRLGLGGKG